MSAKQYDALDTLPDLDGGVFARLGMVLNNKTPIFTLRIINWEQHVAQLALEVEQRVREALGADMQVYVGSSKGNY